MQPDDSHLNALPPEMRATLLNMRQSRPRRFGYTALLVLATASIAVALALASLL